MKAPVRFGVVGWMVTIVSLVLASGCGDDGAAGSGGSSGSGGAEIFDAYPANLCVGEKQAAAGRFCRAVFDAWASWEQAQDSGSRDAVLAQARAALEEDWMTAEAAAETEESDCADLALAAGDAVSMIEADVTGVADAVNAGLDLRSRESAACGERVLSAAADACSTLLKAESRHIRSLDADADGSTLEAAKKDALDTLRAALRGATAAGCPESPASDEIAAEIASISDQLVLGTIVTPGLNDSRYTRLTPGPTDYLGRTYTPQCVQGSDYSYFARRGSVNKLLVYYQGGGACWNGLTCGIPTCRARPNDDLDEFAADGFFDLDDERNPFRAWNIIFVTYCSCDIHFGDASVTYEGRAEATQHLGFHNAKVVEKWAREHFLNPEVVFVTGSSAGAYGAWFHGPLLREVWPASRMHVLADAGNGVITQDFLQNEFSNWNFVVNLPDVPGVLEAITEGGGMPAYTEAVATRFPDINWAHYSTLYDGSPGGQSGFFNVMLNDGSPAGTVTWWEASCQFGELALSQSEETFAAVPGNYRYYFGTGSAHTAFRSDKVYDDTTGGVPALVDWITPMLASGPDGRDENWTNVLCENCGVLLQGDPQPSPLQPPFEQRGESVVVVCE